MVESRRLPQFSDLVCSHKGHHKRVPMDLIGREVVEDLLLHAPPVHEARVDQKGMFARTITFTDGEGDY